MSIEYFWDVEQNTDEWHLLKCGLLSASDASAIMANGEGRRKAIYRVACERVTGTPSESFQSDAMRRGKEQEAEARAKFALVDGCDPKTIGFIRNGRAGCSPDALIGKNRVLEIKTQRADLLAETLFKGVFPNEHIPQTQWQLWCSERDKTSLAIYCRKMPLFRSEKGRDERYIKTLADAVDRANAEIDLVERRIRGYGII